jgi:hypothetical protein
MEEKKGEIEEVAKEGETKELDIIDQSEEAIQAAGELLEGFDAIVRDDSKRQKATHGTGVVVGAGINYMLDAAEETDEKKKSVAMHKGGITLLEIISGAAKTLIAGQRKRNRAGGK